MRQSWPSMREAITLEVRAGLVLGLSQKKCSESPGRCKGHPESVNQVGGFGRKQGNCLRKYTRKCKIHQLH